MRAVNWLIVALALSACSRPAEESTVAAARPEPVVVYASFEDENYLPSLFDDFTRETGIPVTVRHRPEHQIVGEVIANKGAPPADLLLTRSVHGVWRAADEGALRPLQSDTIATTVPRWFRDPDGYWTGIGFQSTEVVCGAERRSDCDAVEAYEDLGKAEFRGRVCLSASSLAVNRTLVAGLIADRGARPAELVVRGWVANLALPPLESEAALLQAVEAGTCGLAVVSGGAIHDYGKPTIATAWPKPGYFDVWAVGINRHARSPDAARSLAEWLVGDHAQVKQSEAAGQRPVTSAGKFELPEAGMRNAAIFGFHAADAAKLAERARWD